MNNVIEQLKKYWASKNIQFNNGIGGDLTDPIESDYGLKFPEDFRQYLMEINGMSEYEMDNLTTLWDYKRFARMTDKFFLHEKYSSSFRESLNTKVPYNSLSYESSEPYSRLRSPATYNKNDEKMSDPKWLLASAEQYFLFGDYNIEGSHWAIKLIGEKKKNSNVVVISEHTNSFRYIARTFTEFLLIYINDCAEALI